MLSSSLFSVILELDVELMLNKKSNYLVVLVPTYNRLESLKRTLTSIKTQTNCSHEVIVIDGGSSDGTVEFLKIQADVTPVFQESLKGQARSCNEVWRQINCKYTVWLSDDTELTNNCLDCATKILETDSEIGMVGLKMKDTVGPGKNRAYMGALSEYKILNCNHGVISLDLLRSVGFFNEDYYSYNIDPDITASVLCTGKKVVMTKKISVLHHRIEDQLQVLKKGI